MANGWEMRVVKLEAKFSNILDRLIKMDAKMDGLDHIIRGNGKPGLVTELVRQDKRIEVLEASKSHWKSFITTVLSGGMVAAIIEIVRHYRP